MLTTSEITHDSRILNEATSLSKLYKVTVIAKKYPNQKLNHYPFKLKLVEFRRFSSRLLTIFSSFFYLIRAALAESPDVFHGHDLDGILCSFPAVVRRRTILIYDSHEFWSDTYPFSNLKGIKWFLPILERMLIWKVKAGISVNWSLANLLSKKYAKKFVAVYNVGTSRINRKSPYKFIKMFPKQKIILHLGAADEGRGLEQMIIAAQILGEKYAFVFLGGGKTEKEMIKMKSDLKVSNVYFLPSVAPEEIKSTISQADLALALTQPISKSYYYSLPNKIFQYIDAEVPILGSDFPEFKEVIAKNQIGEVVDSTKPKLFAKKIREMTKRSSKYTDLMKSPALKKKYSWPEQEKILRKFYQEVFND